MTPFAMEIVRQATKRSRNPWENKSDGDTSRRLVVLTAMQILGGQSFEVSPVWPLLTEFADNHFPHHVDPDLMFWPHANVWFEWGRDGYRDAVSVVCEGGPKDDALVQYIHFDPAPGKGCHFMKTLLMRPGGVGVRLDGSNDVRSEKLSAWVAAMLTAVNQPGILPQTEFPAHRGLVQKAKKRLPFGQGSRVLPWRQVTLGEPADSHRSGDGPHVGHNSGRCYHFVRAHVRRANGQFVRSHWRGDPAIGIGRKSYSLKRGPQAA